MDELVSTEYTDSAYRVVEAGRVLWTVSVVYKALVNIQAFLTKQR